MTCLLPASSTFFPAVRQVSWSENPYSHLLFQAPLLLCVMPMRQSVSLESTLRACVSFGSHRPGVMTPLLLSVCLLWSILLQSPQLGFLSMWPLNICMSWGCMLPHFISFILHLEFSHALSGLKLLLVWAPSGWSHGWKCWMNPIHVSLQSPWRGQQFKNLCLIDHTIKNQKIHVWIFYLLLYFLLRK